MNIRRKIQKAINSALEQNHLFENLKPNVQTLMKMPASMEDFPLGIKGLKHRIELVTDTSLLNKIESLLPKDYWPPQIHHKMAVKLNISRKKSWNAISTLIIEGRVDNPNLKHKK